MLNVFQELSEAKSCTMKSSPLLRLSPHLTIDITHDPRPPKEVSFVWWDAILFSFGFWDKSNFSFKFFCLFVFFFFVVAPSIEKSQKNKVERVFLSTHKCFFFFFWWNSNDSLRLVLLVHFSAFGLRGNELLSDPFGCWFCWLSCVESFMQIQSKDRNLMLNYWRSSSRRPPSCRLCCYIGVSCGTLSTDNNHFSHMKV